MSKNLADFRRIYSKGQLLESEIPEDPLILFENWFEQMEKIKDLVEVNAMTISTVGLDDYPKNRVVLLKEFGNEGFTFFTNYNSEKGKALAHNPNICLSFFWSELERQVIIKGKAEKCSEEKSKEYFKSRPRGSQLSAWASNQSAEINSRQTLERSVSELEAKYKEKEIPKPDFWGGYLVRPFSIEFWQGRPNRLHDRILYTNEGKIWTNKRLAP